MIQRIQTVFWLFAGIAAASLFILPYATIEINNLAYSVNLMGTTHPESGEKIVNAWPLMVLAVVILLIQLVTITQFKNRVLQMRLTIYNMLLLIGWSLVGYFYADQAAVMLEGTLEPAYISVMPIVAIILNFLAWRGVRKDYLMLKAVDRIR